MELPVWENGERIGALEVRREGLYLVFRARLPLREGLPRLWLCGEGESVCLGLPEPREGRLRLEKRLSRASCAAANRSTIESSGLRSGVGSMRFVYFAISTTIFEPSLTSASGT